MCFLYGTLIPKLLTIGFFGAMNDVRGKFGLPFENELVVGAIFRLETRSQITRLGICVVRDSDSTQHFAPTVSH